MRGGALPAALLLAALGLALAGSPRRVWLWSILVLDATLTILPGSPLPRRWTDAAFLGCWASTAATAAAVHLPRELDVGRGVLLSLNAGIWAGAVLGLAGGGLDVLKAMPAVLVVLPASALAARRASVAVKVGASWLIAIAMLCAVLPFLAVTPGYQPDHLE